MAKDNSNKPAEASGRNYWWLNAKSKGWNLSSAKVGDVQPFSSVGGKNKRPNVDKAKTGDIIIGYQTTPKREIVAICEILGEHDSVTNKILIVKVEHLNSPVSLKTLREYLKKHPKLADEEPIRNVHTGEKSIQAGTLFKLTRGGYNLLMRLLREKNKKPSEDKDLEELKQQHLQEWQQQIEEHQQDPEKYRKGSNNQQPSPPLNRDKPKVQWSDPFLDPNPNPFQGTFAKPYRAYTWKNFLGDVYLGKNLAEGREKYGRLVRLLENRKNIILQGPPGVGKTYAAKRLAWSILNSDIDELKKNGGRDPRIQFVQFHQSYSYEDFVEGYKPNDGKEKKDGEFVLQPGVFRRFCEAIKEDNEKAAENGEEKKKFFFIIDEINRGNTSKIFGELLMLIENDHRGEETKLAYSRIDFSVPKNLYIIGMMNTADRNLAMIDYALRRRFAFVDVEPAFESDDENYGFKKYQKKLLERCNETEKTIFTNLIEEVRLLNDAIANDQSLRKGFRIGHSYFCGWENAEDITKKMQDVVECDIIPTLREYWFDDEEAVAGWESGFRSVLNGQEAKGKEELPKS